MTPGIPVNEDPLPDGFYGWEPSEQEEYLMDMDMHDMLEVVAYHTEEEMELFQSKPTNEQMRQLLKQALNIGVEN